jgi:hypothetical protein
MDGFDRSTPNQRNLRRFGYAPTSEVMPYHDMATQYAFSAQPSLALDQEDP